MMTQFIYNAGRLSLIGAIGYRLASASPWQNDDRDQMYPCLSVCICGL